MRFNSKNTDKDNIKFIYKNRLEILESLSSDNDIFQELLDITNEWRDIIINDRELSESEVVRLNEIISIIDTKLIDFNK